MAPTRSHPLAVAQLSLFANLSRNYPLPFQIFHRSSHHLSPCNFLILSYQSSISIVFRPSPPFSVFLDDFSSFLSFAATTPHEFIITGDFNIHLDNPADTLTSVSVSFFLSILVNTFTSLRMTKTTFLIWSQPLPTRYLLRLSLAPIGLHPTTFQSSPDCL